MLTEVSDVVACLVECPPVELEADDGKDDDGKEEEGDVHLPMMMMTTMKLANMKVFFTRGPIALAMDDITTCRPEMERCNEDFFPHLENLHCPIITLLRY